MTEQTYEIKKILNHRVVEGQAELLVEWEGYPKDDATWEKYNSSDSSWDEDRHKVMEYFLQPKVKDLDFRSRLFKIKSRTSMIELEALVVQINAQVSVSGLDFSREEVHTYLKTMAATNNGVMLDVDNNVHFV